MKLILYTLRSGPEGTFGNIIMDGERLCVTCEDPWDDNAKGKSCIPAGIYQCKKHSGAKYQDVWEVCNVPNRTAILIHNGNTIDDTQGCILVGSQFGTINGKQAVLNSKKTLEMLRATLPDEFILHIVRKL